MKNKSYLIKLMDFAGGYKYFTIGSIVLAAASACLALVPFVFIWKITGEVLSVMPDFSKAKKIEDYGFEAVKYAVNAMCVYFCALAIGFADTPHAPSLLPVGNTGRPPPLFAREYASVC